MRPRLFQQFGDHHNPVEKNTPIGDDAIAWISNIPLTATNEEGAASLHPGSALLILKHAKLFCASCDGSGSLPAQLRSPTLRRFSQIKRDLMLALSSLCWHINANVALDLRSVFSSGAMRGI